MILLGHNINRHGDHWLWDPLVTIFTPLLALSILLTKHLLSIWVKSRSNLLASNFSCTTRAQACRLYLGTGILRSKRSDKHPGLSRPRPPFLQSFTCPSGTKENTRHRTLQLRTRHLLLQNALTVLRSHCTVCWVEQMVSAITVVVCKVTGQHCLYSHLSHKV